MELDSFFSDDIVDWLTDIAENGQKEIELLQKALSKLSPAHFLALYIVLHRLRVMRRLQQQELKVFLRKHVKTPTIV